MGPPHPLTRRRCCSPPLGPMGETHSLGGGGGTQFDDGTEILVLKVYINPYTLLLNSMYILHVLTVLLSKRFVLLTLIEK